MTKTPILLTLFSVVALVACGGDDDVGDIGPGDALTSSQISSLCGRGCTKIVECTESQSQAECVTECSPFGAAYRGDLFVDLMECLESLTCEAFGNDPCEAVYEAVVPTETADAFLAAMRAAETRCAATPFFRSSEDDIWPILNDVLLTDLTACMDDPCAQVDDCIGRLDVP